MTEKRKNYSTYRRCARPGPKFAILSRIHWVKHHLVVEVKFMKTTGCGEAARAQYAREVWLKVPYPEKPQPSAHAAARAGLRAKPIPRPISQQCSSAVRGHCIDRCGPAAKKKRDQIACHNRLMPVAPSQEACQDRAGLSGTACSWAR
jgi:hypothetical protein